MTPAPRALQERLAQLTDTNANDWFPVLKARYGMAVAFEALAARPERRDVVTQLLTCATAVDPILAAGARPVYADIDAATFSIAPATAPLDESTAAVVIQHTFGVVAADAALALAHAARAVGASVVEDSAHCAARLARGPDGQPVADISIHSFGVEKMLPTKFGGAVWLNPAMHDADARAAIASRLRELPSPGARLAFAIRTYRAQRGVLNRLPGAIARPLERVLTALGVFEPAVAPAETRGRLTRAPLAASDAVARSVVAALDLLPQMREQRSAAVDAYVGALGGAAGTGARLAGQPLVRFPLVVPEGVDPERVIRCLQDQGVYAGRWYRPVLFPGTASPASYHFSPGDGSVPVTDRVVARLVNLPTQVSPDEARRIAALALAAIDSSRDART